MADKEHPFVNQLEEEGAARAAQKPIADLLVDRLGDRLPDLVAYLEKWGLHALYGAHSLALTLRERRPDLFDDEPAEEPAP
jgi:hypothetical protein